jgi:hypothetical protein
VRERHRNATGREYDSFDHLEAEGAIERLARQCCHELQLPESSCTRRIGAHVVELAGESLPRVRRVHEESANARGLGARVEKWICGVLGLISTV